MLRFAERTRVPCPNMRNMPNTSDITRRTIPASVQRALGSQQLPTGLSRKNAELAHQLAAAGLSQPNGAIADSLAALATSRGDRAAFGERP